MACEVINREWSRRRVALFVHDREDYHLALRIFFLEVSGKLRPPHTTGWGTSTAWSSIIRELFLCRDCPSEHNFKSADVSKISPAI